MRTWWNSWPFHMVSDWPFSLYQKAWCSLLTAWKRLLARARARNLKLQAAHYDRLADWEIDHGKVNHASWWRSRAKNLRAEAEELRKR